MPKQKSAKAGVAPRTIEDTIIREEPVVLTLEERTALRAMFVSIPFKKALHNARLKRPMESLPLSITDGPNGAIAANNQYHRMQGWRWFELALGRAVEDPRVTPVVPPDDYRRDR